MATTTATLTITSADLFEETALNLSATTTLYDGDTVSTGLTQCSMGRVDVLVDSTSYDLIPALADAEDHTQYVYIANKATDNTYYVIISIYSEVIGRLYAGDWMFIPWNADDPGGDDSSKNDIEVQAYVGTCPIEYMVFNETDTTNLDNSAD